MVRRLALTTVVAATLAAALTAPVPAAHATFPGRNGTIAVQPLTGDGLLLVGPGSAHARRLCPVDLPCGPATAPSWSVDGRLIAFGSRRGGDDALYPDGTCFTCGFGDTTKIAFYDRPFQLTVASQYDGIQNILQDENDYTTLSADALDWSSTGRLAIARHGYVVAGAPARLSSLEPGGAPSWSPDGRRLTFARNGWVVTLRPGGRPHRLVRGSAPVYSPDGRRIAFFDERDRLRTVSASGGRTRHIGRITGLRAAWQPLPTSAGGPPAACAPPSGASVISATPQSTITRLPVPGDRGIAALLGCAGASGEPRLVGVLDDGSANSAMLDRVVRSPSGTVVGIVENYTSHEEESGGTTLGLTDLLTGRTPVDAGLDSENYLSQGLEPSTLVIDDEGAGVALDDYPDSDISPVPTASTECVVVADAHRSVQLACTRVSAAGVPTHQLADLVIGGGVVSWTEDGVGHTTPLP